MNRLKEKYQKDVVPALTKEFGYKNVMAVPRDREGRGQHGPRRGDANAKIVDTGADELARITGQKPVTRRAKKSIAAFKVRKGMPIGDDGHAARRADVGVPRPADEHRAAARPRLQGRVAARASTAAATTRSACATSCCFPRSTT